MTFGANARTNRTHVLLWLARVRELADAQTPVSERFSRDKLNEDLIRYVSRLGYIANGPRLAKKFLEEHGIAVVIEPHLPKTHLDGAAMLGRRGTPVVALILREDRLDNMEQEANDLAAEVLIPRAIWQQSDAFSNPTTKAIRALASELQISPDIVAGRVRYERRNYSLFSKLVGYGQARASFPEVCWK